MQRRLVQNFTFILKWGQGTCSFTKHTRRWAWAYSQYLFPACYSPLRHFFILFPLVCKISKSREWALAWSRKLLMCSCIALHLCIPAGCSTLTFSRIHANTHYSCCDAQQQGKCLQKFTNGE